MGRNTSDILAGRSVAVLALVTAAALLLPIVDQLGIGLAERVERHDRIYTACSATDDANAFVFEAHFA